MDKNWIIERWDTPVSDTKSLTMVSLIDDGTLTLVFEAVRDRVRPRWRMTFKRVPAYRNILEEYRIELWSHLDKTKQRCGHTFTVKDSPWISSFESNEPLLKIHWPDLKHYVITTEDDVIEVLSAFMPTIEEIEPADNDMKLPGKSKVFYYPDDKEQIDKLVTVIKKNNI